jgi:cytochrome c2
MQLDLTHRFAVKGRKAEPRPVFFTVSDPAPAAWADLGFDPPKLDPSLASVHSGGSADAKPTIAAGKELATRYGCIACHSTDGKLEGHSGPSWKGLHGSPRTFADGSTRTADDAYLIESMLEPNKVIVKGYALGMGSYSGVLSESEIQSIVLFIRSLE